MTWSTYNKHKIVIPKDVYQFVFFQVQLHIDMLDGNFYVTDWLLNAIPITLMFLHCWLLCIKISSFDLTWILIFLLVTTIRCIQTNFLNLGSNSNIQYSLVIMYDELLKELKAGKYEQSWVWKLFSHN